MHIAKGVWVDGNGRTVKQPSVSRPLTKPTMVRYKYYITCNKILMKWQTALPQQCSWYLPPSMLLRIFTKTDTSVSQGNLNGYN